ncbi:NADH-quinone oxidoreductase subunit L [Nocardia nova]|uniref:NADH-quinone oxidoreductase subunit L n=1 Tax=Nocardia nova TaxID=37330 RepID=UPI0037B71B5E
MIALPALVGAALVVCGRRADRIAAPAGVVVAMATVVLAVVNAVARPTSSLPMLSGVSFDLAVDGLSAVMVVTVAAIVAAVLLFAAGDLAPDVPRARFYGLMLMFAAAMLTTVTAQTLPALLMAWELMGAASYALIGFHWQDEDRASSGLVAFLTTRTGDLGMYLAAGATLAGGVGGLGLNSMPALPSGWRDAAAAGIVLAALGKSAQLPFSFWLSRAMAGPSPVSALLHSATMVAAGAYLLLRLQPLLAATDWAGPVVAWVGGLTAVALGAVAVCQRDLKQLLAASTCAQVGLMVLAAGVGGVVAGSGQLVAHAVTKSLLFLCAGAWLTALGSKDLVGLRGAARSYPVVGLCFTVGALSLAGVPPFALWLSKDAVLSAARESSTALYVLGFVAAVLGAAYAGRALVLVWSAPAPDAESYWDSEEPGTRRVRDTQRLALVVLAVAALAGASAIVPAVRDRFAAVVSPGPSLGTSAWELAVSGVISILVVAAVARLLRRRGDLRAPETLAQWLWLERGAQRCVVAPVFALARGLARFDDRVLARAVDGAAAVMKATARVLDHRVETVVARAVHGIGGGARDVGRWARRPETGLVHQYYAQAVVGLVVLAAILMVVL